VKNTARVGLFLIVFVALIIGAFQILGKPLFARKHRIYYVRMTDAGGLANGSKVLMAGVQIGEIRQIALSDAHHARLTLSLHEDTRLPVGSEGLIPGSLVGFGESELSIVAPDQVVGYLPDGATIPGSKAGPLDSFLPHGGKEIMANIDKSLDSVRKILQDQGLQKSVKQLVVTASKTLEASQDSLKRFDALADRASSLIASNQTNLQQIIVAAKGTVEQANKFAVALNKFAATGKFQSGTTELLAKASHIEDQSKELLETLNRLAKDPVLHKNLEATTQNIADTTARGPEIADNTKKLTANLVDITDKSKDIPGKISALADQTVKLEDSFKTLVDKFNGVKAPSAEGLKDLRVEADLFRESNPAYWRTDVNLYYPLKEGYVTFGVYDAFASNKINLQLARSFGRLDLRYGIYASTVGVGVDYDLTRRLSLRTDLFDINSLELDAKLRYDFGGGLIGWAGVDRNFERSVSPTFGIGFRE
jgi:phospholipid/cholesterol/gamma-HCH transport system substrate-binding protein